MKTETITVKVDKKEKKAILEHIERNPDYDGLSHYVRTLIRRDMKKSKELNVQQQ